MLRRGEREVGTAWRLRQVGCWGARCALNGGRAARARRKQHSRAVTHQVQVVPDHLHQPVQVPLVVRADLMRGKHGGAASLTGQTLAAPPLRGLGGRHATAQSRRLRDAREKSVSGWGLPCARHPLPPTQTRPTHRAVVRQLVHHLQLLDGDLVDLVDLADGGCGSRSVGVG